MNTLIFLALFSLLGLIYFILGLRASKKVTTDADYFVAGRQLGVAQITCNLIATQLGGGLLLGTAAQAYDLGFYGIFYTVSMGLGFLLLASGIASRLQQYKVTTTAQLFEIEYGSSALKQVASLLSIATLFGILVAQVTGFRSLMAGIGFVSPFATVPLWLSVVAYTTIGGLRAITINDMVQLCIITVTFGSIFMYTLLNEPASFFSLSGLAEFQKSFTYKVPSCAALLPTILMPALFSLIEQDLAQRFFASRSRAVATASAFNAAIFLTIFSVIPVYFGMKAKALALEFPTGGSPLIGFLSTVTNDFFFSLALCAIIAAIISTADALINGISANITQDFNLGFSTSSNKLVWSKYVSLAVGVGALGASYFVPRDVIGIMIDSYALSVFCLLVPLLACYYKKNGTAKSAWASIVAGLVGFVFFKMVPVPYSELITLGLSCGAYLIAHRIR